MLFQVGELLFLWILFFLQYKSICSRIVLRANNGICRCSCTPNYRQYLVLFVVRKKSQVFDSYSENRFSRIYLRERSCRWYAAWQGRIEPYFSQAISTHASRKLHNIDCERERSRCVFDVYSMTIATVIIKCFKNEQEKHSCPWLHHGMSRM